MPASYVSSRRFRWWALVAAWLLFAIALPAPGVWANTGWFPNPVPLWMLLIVVFGIPQAFPVWLAVISFGLSPFFVRMRPRGLAWWFWWIPPLAMFGVWVLPILYCRSPADWVRPGRGYYLWACACMLAWLATLMTRSPGQRPNRLRGFDVILPPPGPKSQ